MRVARRAAPVLLAGLLFAPAAVAAPRAAHQSTVATGTVLSSGGGTLRVVDAHHRVHGFRVAGRVPHLSLGMVVRYRVLHARAGHVLVTGHSRRVRFLARVVHSGRAGLTLALGDGTNLRLGARQLHRSRRHLHGGRARTIAYADSALPPVQVNVQGLAAGETIMVTEELLPDGTLSITITLPPPGTPAPGAEQTVSGTVASVDDQGLAVIGADGYDVELTADPDLLSSSGVSECDLVTVSYHTEGTVLVADDVQVTGASSEAACAPDQDSVGTVTAVSADSITIASDQGPQTFSLDDPSLADGVNVGDQVDVSWYVNDAGAQAADDVEPVNG